MAAYVQATPRDAPRGPGVAKGSGEMTDVQTRPDAETTVAKPTCQGAGSSRRVVLAGASALGVGCLLAACGTDTGGGAGSNGANGGDFSNDPAPAGSKGADTGATSGGDTSGGSSGGGEALALVADVPEGGGIIKGDYIITQPASGH